MSAPQIGEDWQNRLLALGVEKDWEGSQITPEAISTVEQFCTVPCNDGGIQLEIHRDGFDIEINIGPGGRIEAALVCCEKAKRPAASFSGLS